MAAFKSNLECTTSKVTSAYVEIRHQYFPEGDGVSFGGVQSARLTEAFALAALSPVGQLQFDAAVPGVGSRRIPRIERLELAEPVRRQTLRWDTLSDEIFDDR